MDNKIVENRFAISFDSVAMVLLYAYLALNSLEYITWIPSNLVTYTLYGFVITSFIAMILSNVCYLTPHVKWYGAFVAFCVISVIYSCSRSDSSNIVFQEIKIFAFLLCFSNVVYNKDRLKNVMGVLSISTFLLFLNLWQTNQLILENTRLGNDLTGNANTFSSLFMMGALCSIYFIFYSKKTRYKIAYFIIFVAQEFAMALAGGRKFFALPIILLLVLFVMLQDKNGRNHFLRRGAIAICILFVLYYLVYNVPLLYDNIGYRFEGLIEGFLGTGDYDHSAQSRIEMINSALNYWSTSPLFGYGIDTFKVVSSSDAYAHNNYAELLCDIGLFGTIIYYYFFVAFLRVYRQTLADKSLKVYWLLLGIIILFFDYGAVSYYAVPSQILLIILPMGLDLLCDEVDTYNT